MFRLYILLAVGGIVAGIVGGGYWYVTGVIEENAQLERANNKLQANNKRLEKEKLRIEMANKLEDARQERARKEQMEAAQKAAAEKARVDEKRLSEASREKAELVEKLAHKAIRNNVDVLECKSDLSNVETGEKDTACAGSVR